MGMFMYLCLCGLCMCLGMCLCVSVFVSVYVCVFICICVCACVCVSLCVSVLVYGCLSVCLCGVYLYERVCIVCLSVCVQVCALSVSVSVFMSVYASAWCVCVSGWLCMAVYGVGGCVWLCGVCVCLYTPVSVFVCVYGGMFGYTCIYLFVCLCLCVCSCMSVSVCVCVCTCTCTHECLCFYIVRSWLLIMDSLSGFPGGIFIFQGIKWLKFVHKLEGFSSSLWGSGQAHVGWWVIIGTHPKWLLCHFLAHFGQIGAVRWWVTSGSLTSGACICSL